MYGNQYFEKEFYFEQYINLKQGNLTVDTLRYQELECLWFEEER